MDPLTHYMLALLIASRQGLDRERTRAFLVASVVPDIDLVMVVFGWSVLARTHATVMGNLIVLPLLAAVVAWMLARDPQRFRRVLPGCLAGVLRHAAIDLGIGLPILWEGNARCLRPFSETVCLVSTWGLFPREVFIAAQLLLLAVGWGGFAVMVSRGVRPWAALRAPPEDGT